VTEEAREVQEIVLFDWKGMILGIQDQRDEWEKVV